MTTHRAPIVGMAFRPPANDLIMLLPVGSKLALLREPDNPHDQDAIKVLLVDFDEDGPHAGLLEYFGEMSESDVYGHLKWNKDALTNPFHLGYVANSEKTGGKYASEICPLIGEEPYPAALAFSETGRPQAQFEIALIEEPGEFKEDEEA